MSGDNPTRISLYEAVRRYLWSLDRVEVWKDVVGFKGKYKVSNQGRVKTVARTYWRPHENGSMVLCRIQEKILTGTNKSGYIKVCLVGVGQVRVHRLVLEAFVGPCPEGMECLHWDGDRANNRRHNLRWGTRSENIADAKRHGTFSSPPHYKGELNGKAVIKNHQITEVHRLYRSGLSLEEVGDIFGVTSFPIRMIISGRTFKDHQPPPELRAVLRPTGRKKKQFHPSPL